MADLLLRPSFSDRRKHARIDLRVMARIFRGTEVIRITTQNISIGGFYALCEERFTCGEQFDSVIDISGQLHPSSNSGAHLQCVVRVVRVETMPLDGRGDEVERFGVAFSVEDYRVATAQSSD
jgi:c-di-GMP-binding flagellar brake protein YcgR